MRQSIESNKQDKVNRMLNLYTKSTASNRAASAKVNKNYFNVPNLNTQNKTKDLQIPIIKNNSNLFTRIKSANKTNIEKETLYEDCINLKAILNSLNKELHFYKSEVNKKDFELKKQSKIMENIFSDTELEYAIHDMKAFNKVKENNLVQNLKKKYKELKKEFEVKVSEIEELKRLNKTTKINEVRIENQILIEENKKMRWNNEDYRRINFEYDKLKKEYSILHENFIKLQEDGKSSHNGAIEENVKNININNNQQINSIWENNGKFLINNSKNKLNNSITATTSSVQYKSLLKEIEAKNKIISELEKELKKYTTTLNNKIEKINNNITPGLNKNINTTNLISNKNTNAIIDLTSNLQNLLNEEQINEYTFILKKNLEVKFIDSNKLNEIILSSSDIEDISNKFINLLKVKNINDKSKILTYIRSINKLNKENIKEVKHTLSYLFNDIILYNDNKDKITKTLIKKILKKSYNHLISSFKYYDIGQATNNKENKLINFSIFKKIIQNLNLGQITEKHFEYLIYLMKIEETQSQRIGLEELKYDRIINLLNEDSEDKLIDDACIMVKSGLNQSEMDVEKNKTFNEKKDDNNNLTENLEKEINKNFRGDKDSNGYDNKNNNTNINNNSNQEEEEEEEEEEEKEEEKEDKDDDDEEVVLTMKEFNQKVDQILSKLADILVQTKKTVRSFFQSSITIHTVTPSETYEAIPLVDFISALKQINLPIDTIDIYCIYTKLKYSDDYEMIDVSKLVEEMLNYGIFEDYFNLNTPNNNGNTNGNNNGLIHLLNRIFTENGIDLDTFLSPILGQIEIFNTPNGYVKIVKQKDFLEIMKDFGINTPVQIDLEYLINDNVNLTMITKSLDKQNIQAMDRIKEKDSEDEFSVDFDKIDDMNVEGLDDL